VQAITIGRYDSPEISHAQNADNYVIDLPANTQPPSDKAKKDKR
jgi:hypothetical protein